MPWSEVDAQYRVHRGHAYTYSSQLPYRCLEALYIVTLLEKGFGFDKDARDITLALEVRFEIIYQQNCFFFFIFLEKLNPYFQLHVFISS